MVISRFYALQHGSLFFLKQLTKIYFTRRNGQPRGPLQAALAVVPTYHVETNSD